MGDTQPTPVKKYASAPFSNNGRLVGDIKYGEMVINLRKPPCPIYIDATCGQDITTHCNDESNNNGYCSVM